MSICFSGLKLQRLLSDCTIGLYWAEQIMSRSICFITQNVEKIWIHFWIWHCFHIRRWTTLYGRRSSSASTYTRETGSFHTAPQGVGAPHTHREKRKVLVQIPEYCQTSATSSQSTCLRVRWQLRNCRHHTQDNQDVLWTPTDSTHGNKCTKNTLWQSTINNSFHYICVIIIFHNINHQYCWTICKIIGKKLQILFGKGMERF